MISDSNNLFNKASACKRDAVSDDEEEKNPKEGVFRKAEMLDIDNSDDEF